MAVVELFKEFLAPASLAVIRIQDLEPRLRLTRIGRELVLGHNSLQVLVADKPVVASIILPLLPFLYRAILSRVQPIRNQPFAHEGDGHSTVPLLYGA